MAVILKSLLKNVLDLAFAQGILLLIDKRGGKYTINYACLIIAGRIFLHLSLCLV